MPASCIGAELLNRVIARRHARKSICFLQSVDFLLLQKYLIAFPSSVLILLFSKCLPLHCCCSKGRDLVICEEVEIGGRAWQYGSGA